VQEVGRSGDVGDAAVAELGEVPHGGGDPRPVVHQHRREAAGPVRAGDGHGRQVELLEERDPWVGDPQVEQEHPVDPPGGGQPAVSGLLRGLGHHLQDQGLPAVGQRPLDAGDEGGEERVGAEQLGLPGEDQPDGERPGDRQCAGLGARGPAEVAGGRQDPLTGLLGDPGPAVQRERNGAFGNTGGPGHVPDRRPVFPGHGTPLELLNRFDRNIDRFLNLHNRRRPHHRMGMDGIDFPLSGARLRASVDNAPSVPTLRLARWCQRRVGAVSETLRIVRTPQIPALRTQEETLNDLRPEPLPVPQSRTARAALIAGGGVYFTAEFVAAAAWTDPPYSYTHHFISNLGVHGPSTAFGQFMHSPLAWVMNTGFFLFGLVTLAGVLALRGLPSGRRRAAVAMAVLLAAGSILVALFPGSGEASATGAYHGLGAFTAFAAGNVLVILLGRAHRFLGVSRRLGRALVLLGVLGFASLAAFMAILASGAGVLIGLAERGVIYSFLIGLILLGAALATAQRSVYRRPSA
jgi:hypothetical membrane protein